MGQRWSRYLLDYRIRLAAGLLRPKNARISFVAQECGFPTLSHFNASFRKVMGMAPRDFYKKSELKFASRDGVGKSGKVNSKSFTLVELLVTISIIGLLAGLAIPAVRTARETAAMGGCLSNLRQLSAGMLSYASDNQGRIYCGTTTLTEGWAHDLNDNVTNGKLWSGGYVQNLKVFLCPHGRKPAQSWFGSSVCHYSMNVNTNLAPVGATEFFLNRVQNPSKVIMIFEEAVTTSAQIKDSRAGLNINFPVGQADNRLLTRESGGLVNHRTRGCVSFYDGSAASFSAQEWTNMINSTTKRRVVFGEP
jgi:prepilin-type N-terminal cleavage/methylation domain-containing protein